jgi:hypothetical protein
MKTPAMASLAAELPKNFWGKILSATPVVMTVVATMLAGLASSEMTRAQYDRAFAAQLQSKAGDQWSFFQAKKLRSAMQQSTLDGITATMDTRPVVAATLMEQLAATPAAETVKSEAGRAALRVLEGAPLPKPPAAPPLDAKLKAAVDGLEKSLPDAEFTELVKNVDDAVLASTLRQARDRALALDALTSPLSDAIDSFEAAVLQTEPGKNANASGGRRDFTVARLNYNARRYELEARHNQSIAELYELQVRKNNLSAERHHRRSGQFFYGMLAAQMAVIMASFAMAARKRSFLWSLAAAAGLAAIAFAIYVYLYV